MTRAETCRLLEHVGIVPVVRAPSPEIAIRAVDAGAQFIVSPGLDLGTIDAAHALDVAVAPGALTPTEVITAKK